MEQSSPTLPSSPASLSTSTLASNPREFPTTITGKLLKGSLTLLTGLLVIPGVLEEEVEEVV